MIGEAVYNVDIFNNSISSLITSNISFRETCELNQIAMLNQLEKLPKNLFILICIATFALIIYAFVLPKIKNIDWRKTLGTPLITFVLVLNIFALVFCASLTFNITEKGWTTIVWVVGGLTLLALIIRTVISWEDIKELIKKMGEE